LQQEFSESVKRLGNKMVEIEEEAGSFYNTEVEWKIN
jgi:hypothetical protein